MRSPDEIRADLAISEYTSARSRLVQDVPALLAEVERLTAENERLSEDEYYRRAYSLRRTNYDLTNELDVLRAAVAKVREALRGAHRRAHENCEPGHSTQSEGCYACAIWENPVLAALAGAAPEPAREPATVEIGGQRMTQAQFDAARFPLLAGDPGPASPDDAMSVEFGAAPEGDPPGEQRHTRGYAGRGPDIGQDRGAYCIECSAAAQDYVWPCRVAAVVQATPEQDEQR